MKLTLLAVSALSVITTAYAASLAEAYRDDFLVGVALGGTVPADYSKAERELIEREFNQFTPENCMKPALVQPEEGKWTFEMGDALVDYGTKRGIPVYGHTLVWHHQSPDWYFKDGDKPASRELALKRLRAHIHEVVGRYRGRLVGWDVVNEAISDKPGEYLRPTKWLEAVGEDYIAQAFRFAHEADPTAELQYNDYSIEGPEKRAKTIKLLKSLLDAGVPVHSVGIQGHWSFDHVPMKDIDDAIREFSALGLKVSITELDLDVIPGERGGADLNRQGPSNKKIERKPLSAEDAQKQAEIYGQLFSIFRAHRDVITRVTFWNLHDGRSWLNGWPTPRFNHPLLFDRDAKPKPAYEAVLKAAKK